MELRHLRYFVAVAEELNVRRAARRLYMEQPSLSRQIQQLEGEIGVPLFRRVKRHIELTEAGQTFLDETRRTLAQVEQSVEAARQAHQRERRSLHVSACFALTQYSPAFDTAFAQTVRAFRERHPGIGLTLGERDTTAQEQALREGICDIGFSPPLPTGDGLICRPLFCEPLVLVLPRDHPLADSPAVSPALLRQEVLFLFPEQVSPTLHQEILTASEKAGFRPRSVQTAESLPKALWLVGAGLGVTFVGKSLKATQPPGVVFRSVRDFALELEFAAVWRGDNHHPLRADFVRLAGEMTEPLTA